MKDRSSHLRNARHTAHAPAIQPRAATARRRPGPLTESRRESIVEPQSNFRQIEYASPRPLAELLQCSPAVGSLLNQAARSLEVAEGQIVFHQGEACQGLYVIVSGLFTRRAERHSIRLALGPARPGDLVELGAALGDNLHTFTLSAQSAGSLLLLPIDALRFAFDSFPPLRMQLLEELAREVSRGYFNCCQNRIGKARRPLEATP